MRTARAQVRLRTAPAQISQNCPHAHSYPHTYSGLLISSSTTQILLRRRQGGIQLLTWVWSFRWVNSTITMSNFQVSTHFSKKVLIFLLNLKNFDFLLRHCWDSKICVNLSSNVRRNTYIQSSKWYLWKLILCTVKSHFEPAGSIKIATFLVRVVFKSG